MKKNIVINNLVAKHCHQFNRPKIEEDKKTVYKRKAKHNQKKYVEYFLMFSV